MDKKSIETFIKKYNLNNLVDQVRWVVKNKTLHVTAMTSDKKFMASVAMNKFDMDKDTEFGIVASPELRSLLSSLGDNISFALDTDEQDPTRVISILLSDENTEASHYCGHLDVVPAEPRVKQLPDFNVEITMTDDFISRFLAAKGSLSGIDLFTVLMNKKKQKLEIVFGYKERNLCSKVSLGNIPTCAGKDKVGNPVSFSANNLKEVLAANSEVKNPVLKISDSGLAYIEFNTPEFQSQYYMIKVDVED